MQSIHAHPQRPRIPWNKGKLVGQKSPFKLKDIWAIRVRLQLAHRTRELALLNLALDSKLRETLYGCGCRTYATESESPIGRSSCSKRPSDRFSSRLPK